MFGIEISLLHRSFQKVEEQVVENCTEIDLLEAEKFE